MAFSSKTFAEFNTFFDERLDMVFDYAEGLERAKKVITEGYTTIIVPNDNGKCLLAKHYHDKYGIEIFIMTDTKNLGAFIEKIRERDGDIKIGIIANTDNAHVVPLIYERNGDKESIINFDTLGPEPKPPSKFNIAAFISLIKSVTSNKNIDFHSCQGIRQVDSYSCVNDAFAILKDALREENITAQLKNPRPAQSAIQTTSHSYTLVQLPERWSKSIQNQKIFDEYKVKINFEDPVARSRKEKPKKSLQQHRNENEKAITRRFLYELSNGTLVKETEETKRINVYLKEKGYSNVTRVKKTYGDRIKNQENLNQIYEQYSDIYGLKNPTIRSNHISTLGGKSS